MKAAKTAIVTEWPVGLSNLRVCTGSPDLGAMNCGRCEKCVRTMLAILALGALPPTHAFGGGSLPVDAVANIRIRSQYAAICYADVIEPLERRGLSGHARAAKAALEEFHRHRSSVAVRDWKGVIKRFDRRVLGGALLKMRSRMRLTAERDP